MSTEALSHNVAATGILEVVPVIEPLVAVILAVGAGRSPIARRLDGVGRDWVTLRLG